LANVQPYKILEAMEMTRNYLCDVVKYVDHIVICSAGHHELNTNVAGWDYVVGADKYTWCV
jgi:hypothetical protein